MLSMTGFGSEEVTSDEIKLQVQVRTVNSRFLEVRLHLPKEYLAEEMKIKSAISEYFQRGHVDVYIHRSVPPSQIQGQVAVHRGLLKSYLTQVKATAKEIGIDSAGILAGVGSIPHLVTVEVQHKVGKKEISDLLSVVHGAAKKCLDQRAKEGDKLGKDIQKNLKALSKIAVSMEKMRQTTAAQSSSVRESRLADLEKRLGFDQAKYIIELLALDKMDISEELVRLKSHVEECLTLLSEDQPVGKRLDFFAQELLREVNTIGSKSQDSNLTRLVVEAKSVIEKLREQVQNLE
jgi:uncharacterized protein (TIGR00255 family)